MKKYNVDIILEYKELMSFCNINFEYTGSSPNLSQEFTLSSAIGLINISRRLPGFIIKFLDKCSS